MKKHLGLFLSLIGVAVAIAFAFAFLSDFQNNPIQPAAEISSRPTAKPEVDYKASFGVYTFGLKRSFIAAMYHNRSKDVFITRDNPEIIYIKKKGLTWGDFFKTMPFSVSEECLITGDGDKLCTDENRVLELYLNGQKKSDLLTTPIQPGDKALITVNDEAQDPDQTQRQFREITDAAK